MFAVCSVTSADDLVLLAERETAVQSISDRISEMGKCYEMELRVEKTRVMKLSRQTPPVQMMIDRKQHLTYSLHGAESFFRR